jgi:hypothetical protein
LDYAITIAGIRAQIQTIGVSSVAAPLLDVATDVSARLTGPA